MLALGYAALIPPSSRPVVPSTAPQTVPCLCLQRRWRAVLFVVSVLDSAHVKELAATVRVNVTKLCVRIAAYVDGLRPWCGMTHSPSYSGGFPFHLSGVQCLSKGHRVAS